MIILAIETSCDETAMALLEANGGLRAPKFKVLKNIVSSQIETHRPFGGVVPNLAKREHLRNLPIIFRNILANSKFQIPNSKQIQNSPDVLAVTVGPGLEPALWTGINFAKEIHKEYFPKAKLMGVNHMEGHLYSFLLTQKTEISNFKFLISKNTFPAIALVVSGGHTILLLMQSFTKWKKLGETRDDAVGEAFDKVARILGLPYPGGPEIQKIAILGSPTSIDFPRPMMRTKDYDFSFSGLKTAVLYYLRDHSYESTKSASWRNENTKSQNFRKKLQTNVAASFQQAAVEVLVYKTMRAVREFGAKSVILAGGVAANKLLRETLQTTTYKLQTNFFAPAMEFNTDNAAMIGAAAYISFLQKKNRRLLAQANLSL